MKFEKPGEPGKKAKILNKRSRMHDIKKPTKLHCRRCNKTIGTERFCHYEGFRKFLFGKGFSQKCDDNMTAWLCQKCADVMDNKPLKGCSIDYQFKIIRHSEEWLYLICLTHLL